MTAVRWSFLEGGPYFLSEKIWSSKEQEELALIYEQTNMKVLLQTTASIVAETL
jgi:hypothetical protein